MADIRKHIEKAEKYLQKGKLQDALESYLVAFREEPSNDGLVEIIAELYLKLNQPGKAVECYGYLFDKRAEQKDAASATLMYRKIARLGHNDPDRLLVCAGLQAQRRPAEARDSYRQAARLLQDRGDTAKVLEALRGLAAIEPTNLDVHLELADAAEKGGAGSVAAEALLRAAGLLAELGDHARAASLLQRAFDLSPNDARIIVAYAKAALESGQPRRALEMLELEPVRTAPERNHLLADSYLAAGNFPRAEDVYWAVAPTYPDVHKRLLEVLQGYFRTSQVSPGLLLVPRIKQTMQAEKRMAEFSEWADQLASQEAPTLEQLEILAALFKELNRDQQYASTMVSAFEAAVEAQRWPKAASALEILTDINIYDSENETRLARLKGNLDADRYRALSHRILGTAQAASGVDEFGLPTDTGEPTGELEDMIVQAELLVQFSPDQAEAYVKKIAAKFPGEETRNERLLSIYQELGLAPKPVSVNRSGAMPAVTQTGQPQAVAQAAEEYVAGIQKVSEIIRNVQRQTSVKEALSVAVNEIGQAWQVSRCVVSLCAPGKPPSAALEYCAPGVASSDVHSLVRLITGCVQFTAGGRTLRVEDGFTAPQYASLAAVAAPLGVQSLLALPMNSSEQQVGVVLLEQCDHPREWRENEVVVLKTLVDQVAFAVEQAKLRSLMRAVADERSGLLNRGSYVDCLLTESARAKENRSALSVALLEFGHGEETLRELGEARTQEFMEQVARLIGAQLRQQDIGVRYDPVRVAVVFPGTAALAVSPFVEKVRKLVAGVAAGNGQSLGVTAGIAEAVIENRIDPVDSVTELINRVEAALEAARTDASGLKVLAPARVAARV